jgi:hypothetical protein
MTQDFVSQMQNLPERAKRWFQRLKVEAKIGTAFSHAAATAATRQIDPGDPRTWLALGRSYSGIMVAWRPGRNQEMQGDDR